MNLALTTGNGRLTRDYPDWDVRSAITLCCGRWTMRNGHTAIVLRSQAFDARKIVDGAPVKFIVWFGRSEQCNEGCSWNANGTYAANGKHQLDIIARAA